MGRSIDKLTEIVREAVLKAGGMTPLRSDNILLTRDTKDLIRKLRI